jgi:hypothetical protein
MAPIAIGIAWLGGWPFGLFWALAACIVLWEWTQLMTRSRNTVSYTDFLVWMIAGFSTPVVLLLAPIILRRDPRSGSSQSVPVRGRLGDRYRRLFAGRALGGPKLWAAVSRTRPGQARSAAALGGVVAALLVVTVAGLVIAQCSSLWRWSCPSPRKPATCSNPR